MKMPITVLVAALLQGFIPDAVADSDFVSGQVINAAGRAEAGVWVIAETDDLHTGFRKIVVTDDEGRFVIPSLPAANYKVWVRGYGLQDSARLSVDLGADLKITVNEAQNAAQAASIYPANYWLSMMRAPSTESLTEAALPYASSKTWLDQFKLNCVICHQPGSAPTRLPQKEVFDHGLRKSALMSGLADQLNRPLLLASLNDWGRRIAAGETPAVAPPRPTGIERNVVLTQWEYGDTHTYAHDVISTDKRKPWLYPNGNIYGVDIGNDHLLVLDPNEHRWSKIKLPAWEGAVPWCDQTYKPLGSDTILPNGAQLLGCPEPGVATLYSGAYNNPVNPHNPMFDDTGKVWLTMQVRREWGEDLPDFCQRDPVIANNDHHRQLGYYDTATGELVSIDTCFGTHHLQFDETGKLWVNGDSYVLGWFDPKRFNPADPASLEAAQGWSEVRVDSNGDGDADLALVGFRYSVIPNPVRADVWATIPPGSYGKFPTYGKPGYITRYDPATGQHEAYSPPYPGAGARGIDVDSQGNLWMGLAGSGHVARFDRTRCKQTWGAGDQCPEGWTLWETPGPRFEGVTDGGSADFHYYVWVDQFNTLGMGVDTVIVNGTNSDSLIAFRPDTEQFTVIRIPYPMVSFTRGVDGRIDDPDAGWKGRGLWLTNGLDPLIHSEVQRTWVGHLQMRPDPLAH